MKLTKIFALLLSIFLIGSSTNAEGTNKIVPKLVSINNIDACKSIDKREVLIVITIGEIESADSLFGFNFEVKYDPSKIKFDRVIWQNTLSEFFELKDYSIIAEDSAIYGYAGNMNPFLSPVHGNLALVAFYGFWLGDCPDSSLVQISYLEYTEEFKKSNDEFENLMLKSEIFDLEDRKIDLNFSKSVVNFISDSTINVELHLDANDNRLTETEIKLNVDDSEFEISSVESLTDAIEILDIADENGGKLLKLQINNYSDVGKLSVNINNRGTIGERLANLSADVISVGNCDCITRFNGTSLLIYSDIPDTNTSVVDYESVLKYSFYDNASQEFVLQFGTNNEKVIMIYDLKGKLVYEISTNESLLRINAEALSVGLYLLYINKQGKEEIKNLIKY